MISSQGTKQQYPNVWSSWYWDDPGLIPIVSDGLAVSSQGHCEGVELACLSMKLSRTCSWFVSSYPGCSGCEDATVFQSRPTKAIDQS